MLSVRYLRCRLPQLFSLVPVVSEEAKIDGLFLETWHRLISLNVPGLMHQHLADSSLFKADMTSMLADMLKSSLTKFASQLKSSSGGQGDSSPNTEEEERKEF